MDSVTIGLICGVFGAVATFITQKRNFKKDTQEESRDFTRVETKLDYVSKGVDDIRLDIRATDRKVSDICERLTRVEESTKSAHHRIDGIEKEGA